MSSILKVDQIQLSNGNTPTAGDLGINDTGTVIQTAYHTHSTSTTLTSTNVWTATGTTLSFTPKAANSTIIIYIKIAGEISGAANTGIGYRLKKDGNTVYDNDYAMYHSNSNDQRIDQIPIIHVESAVNTNARTYALDFRLRGGGQTRHNFYGEPTTMIIQEIAG